MSKSNPIVKPSNLLKAETVALWYAVDWMALVLQEWRRDGFKDAQDQAQYVGQRQRLKLAKQALRKVNRLRKEGL
ncbi:hypothetical protein [Pantoea sp. 18069]|uniref:hypothetical protein n=1 Tax=Pantoea sp. 18069 TaxID=2681415 RepID=UPI0013586D16|nr:hypothetical protein [Pantoea sp. 18069]